MEKAQVQAVCEHNQLKTVSQTTKAAKFSYKLNKIIVIKALGSPKKEKYKTP